MNYVTMIHTLSANYWRRIKKFPCRCGVPVGESSGTFAGGAINWVWRLRTGLNLILPFFVGVLNLGENLGGF